MRGIHIREARAEDAEAMRDVQRRTWIATYPNEGHGITTQDIEAWFHEDPKTAEEKRERRRQAIETPPFHAWVALEATVLIGFCLVKRDDQENLVQALYVLPDCQGKGIGKRLLQTALDWFGMEQEVVLHVVSYNEKAIAFYRAFGFVITRLVASALALQLPSGVRLPEITLVKKGL